jgi:hypothetical protein
MREKMQLAVVWRSQRSRDVNNIHTNSQSSQHLVLLYRPFYSYIFSITFSMFDIKIR